jgi:uncharacterized membrane protein
MQFIHPLIMLGFFYFLFCQTKLGRGILSIRPHSPEADQRDLLTSKHRAWGQALLALGFAGMIGGIVMTRWALGIPEPFARTYGHGIVGLIGLSLLVWGYLLGGKIKTTVKPRIQTRFLTFHTNIIYIVAFFGLLSLVTGIVILVAGPSATAAFQ